MVEGVNRGDDVSITVFLGAPGSGKGTQAKRLALNHGFKHLSTGDILRGAIQAGTTLGLRAKEFVENGDLVPDALMIELIASSLSGFPSSAKVILDGFPRTKPQAVALDNDESTMVRRAVYFKVPEEVLILRLTGRRICEKCSEPYHIKFIRPKNEGVCDKCAGKLIQRADDVENVVVRRLELFNELNKQLLNYYQDRNRLVEIDGFLPVEELQAELIRMLK